MRNKAIFLFVILILNLCRGIGFTSQRAQKTPKYCIIKYYTNIGDKNFKGAYALKSKRAKGKISYNRWYNSWSNNINIGISLIKTKYNNGKKALLIYEISSEDKLSNEKNQFGKYKIKATLVKESGYWWIDDMKVKVLHQVKYKPLTVLVKGTRGKPLPKDIPVYSGFIMKKPLLYKDKTKNFYFSKVVCAKRLKGISPHKIAQYYKKGLKRKGWTTMGPAGGGSCLSIFFKKGNRRVRVSAYRTAWDGTDAPADPRGTHLEIDYWSI